MQPCCGLHELASLDLEYPASWCGEAEEHAVWVQGVLCRGPTTTDGVHPPLQPRINLVCYHNPSFPLSFLLLLMQVTPLPCVVSPLCTCATRCGAWLSVLGVLMPHISYFRNKSAEVLRESILSLLFFHFCVLFVMAVVFESQDQSRSLLNFPGFCIPFCYQ